MWLSLPTLSSAVGDPWEVVEEGKWKEGVDIETMRDVVQDWAQSLEQKGYTVGR